MDLVTIDFETFFDQGYSLSKMTTEEYVRDDRFETIGVSLKVNAEPAVWYSGNDTKGFLNSITYDDKAILCHNTFFDGAILSWLYGIKPKFWFDTLSMSRPTCSVITGGALKNLASHFKLGVKGDDTTTAMGLRRKDFTPAHLRNYGDYCINDNEMTYKLFAKLRSGFPISELVMIDRLIRMYTEPVLELDRDRLQEHLADVRDRRAKLLLKLGGGDPEKAKKTLTSNLRFAALLAAMGVEPPLKTSPTTGKLTYAFAKTDEGMKALLNHENPAVAAVAEVRVGVKSSIEETRTERLIGVSKRGPLPVMLNYYGAHTGRLGGGDKLNLQNLPARKGNAIRCAIRPPEGHKLVVCDSAQIEARLLAYVAGQADLVQAFRDGRDVYSEFASDIYGIKIDRKANPEHAGQGFVGKTGILGLGYGCGPDKFRLMLMNGKVTMDLSECKRIVYMYRDKYDRIKVLWQTGDRVLNDMMTGQSGVFGGIVPYGPEGFHLPNGMFLKYHGLRRGANGFEYIPDNRQWRKFITGRVTGVDETKYKGVYGGAVTENVVQALARIVVSEQMAALSKAGLNCVLQVHDENVAVTPQNKADAAKELMLRVMSMPPAWAPNLPIACEAGIGDSYGEAK